MRLVPPFIASLAFAASALAQPETRDALLAMPPAPGVEALLMAQPDDPRVVSRWIGLLTDANADLRLSAARALGATNVRSATPRLLQALASEQDPAVLGEIIRAIAIVAPDGDIVQLYAHADRVHGRSWTQTLDALAAARPALVATHIRTESRLRARADAIATAYARIARTQPALASTIETAPEVVGDATVVTGILQGAARIRRPLPATLIDAGLRQGPAVRIEALTYVAEMYRTPKAAREALGDVALPAAGAGEPGAEELWMRALEQRWLTGKDGGRLAALIPALPDVAWIERTPLPLLGVLSADERKAYIKRFALPDQLARALREMKLGDSILNTPPTPVPEMTLLARLPGVMLADVVRTTGCAPQAGDEQFAGIRYRADGRPAAVAFAPNAWSPGCERAAKAAVSMAYGTPPLAPGDQSNALVRLDGEFIACLASRPVRAVDGPEGRHVAGITAPTKLRNVNPTYPADALNARVQGVVIIEALIEPSGCIGEARVVRPVRPSLDAEAMRTVTRWQYTPTLLRGTPVPVVMTVTVNFALQ